MARRARIQAQRHPVAPRSLEDLVLPPDYIRTNKGENFLLSEVELRTEEGTPTKAVDQELASAAFEKWYYRFGFGNEVHLGEKMK
ncbi:hypothetical protein ACHWQZ_G008410 [Mnemiopsis leidyi]